LSGEGHRDALFFAIATIIVHGVLIEKWHAHDPHWSVACSLILKGCEGHRANLVAEFNPPLQILAIQIITETMKQETKHQTSFIIHNNSK